MHRSVGPGPLYFGTVSRHFFALDGHERYRRHDRCSPIKTKVQWTRPFEWAHGLFSAVGIKEL
jgi:hypothetical protein